MRIKNSFSLNNVYGLELWVLDDTQYNHHLMPWEMFFQFKHQPLGYSFTFLFRLAHNPSECLLGDRLQTYITILTNVVDRVFMAKKQKDKVDNILTTIKVRKPIHWQVIVG
jgi:hypothetical protein